MSGSFTKKWTPEQKRAIHRAVLDDGLKVPTAAKKAAAGELRLELGGPLLEPFAMPVGTIRRTVDDERKRRRELAVQAAAIDDPDLYSREMIRLLMAEARQELTKMHQWLHSGRNHRRESAWAEITEAAKTIESLAKASAAVSKQPHGGKGSNTPEPEDKASLVSSLAKQRPKRSEGKAKADEHNNGAATQATEPNPAAEGRSPVPSYALADPR